MAEIRAESIIKDSGFLVKSFPVVEMGKMIQTTLEGDIVDVSDTFKFAFENAGYMHNGVIYTTKIVEHKEKSIKLG